MEKALAAPVLRSPYALVDALNREWAALLEDLPVERPDLVEGVEAARRGEDSALHRLVAATLTGDRLAGRAVLQSQLGRLVRMAGRDARAGVDEYVSTFWCVLARYPLPRRPERIAANLALDTLKEVQRDRQWMGRSPAVVHPLGDDLGPLLERAGPPVDDGPEAAAVIRAGERLRLIDPPTGHLLRAVYVDGLPGREAALRCSTTPLSLRSRCCRAVHRLAAHAAELAEAA